MTQSLVICFLATSVAISSLAQAQPSKLMEFGKYNCEDEMSKLDYLAVQLQDNPEAYGYIVVYGGRRVGKEYLWRIELVFNNGQVWIIPRRIKNLDEINNFVATLPGTHQKRITS